MNKRRGEPERRVERGHLMAGLMAAIAIMLIFSTMTFQSWQEVHRRDAEAEMIFRGQEIARAIVAYRRDQRISPEKLEDLMEAGSKGQYFLRHLYEDPLVRNGKWQLLYDGPGGEIIDPTVTPIREGGLPAQGIDLGLGNDSRRGADRNRSGQRDRIAGRGAGRGRGRDRGDGAIGAPEAGSVAGLRIAGVKSLCEKRPFRVYKGFEEYKDWLFSYRDYEGQQVPGQGVDGTSGRDGSGGRGAGAGAVPGGSRGGSSFGSGKRGRGRTPGR